MKCDWREFIKPTGARVFLALLLLSITISINWATFLHEGDFSNMQVVPVAKGLPLTVNSLACPVNTIQPGKDCNALQTDFSALLADAVFWYLVAALLVTAYNQLQKTRGK